MKKKYIVIILVLIIALVVSIYFYNKEATIILKDDLTTNIFTQKTNLSFIQEVKYGSIITKNELIDTSKLGNKEISLSIKNKLGKKSIYKFTINIIDKEPPQINAPAKIETTVGVKPDFLKNIEASDNSKEQIEVAVEGEYDINKVGEYKLYYTAKDYSNNITKKEVILIVKEASNPINQNKIMADRKFTTPNGYEAEINNGVLYIDGILIANKTYYLPSNYGNGLTKKTKEAFSAMQSIAKEEGLNIYISSGFRTYETQSKLYNNYVARDGNNAADTYSARPGHSEHQTGLAFDVNTINNSFANTKEGLWLASNCYKFGFILRYPQGKTNETGYIYEPWHFRYVGEELATKLYNNGDWQTLESYFGITSEYE